MKRPLLFIILLFTTSVSFSQTQGRIVINEYMAWPASACGDDGEFIELLNFGPGPVNIGCYIVTTGKYAITIPPNTILEPGQFYLLAGKSFLPGSCGNVDSTAVGVYANLNWSTCGCTNIPIPATGIMTDGGSASTQLVILDPNKKVIDAVVRSLPGETNFAITSSTVSGGCASKAFNLDTMNISYETLGMSMGRGNSFARKLDGDCDWVKQPQISGKATNNTSGTYSNVTYDFYPIQSM
ncbi:MAG: lamin tail domain-containing protein, partial [Chitinophagaceae bacterium]|nr:lamin tail domain-containing protein [Chitinophagaceae bacterium]